MEAQGATQALADDVERWCKEVHDNIRAHRLFVVSGPFGCGKTMALKGAARYVRDIYMDVWPRFWGHPITSLVVPWPKFCEDYERGRAVEFYDDVCSAHVVFLDDVGAEADRFRSGGKSELLGNLLSDLATKFVFITTNMDPDQWREKWGGRVEDRLNRNATLCNLWALGARSFVLEGQ